jgi:hypothetical protein
MSEHLHDWLDEREPDDKPSLWDERDDTPYDPEPPEDREPDVYIHRQAGGVGWNEPAVLWDGIQEREGEE